MAGFDEADILAVIDRHFPNRHPRFGMVRGDDCAFLRPDAEICVSADLFMEDTHFRSGYFMPEEIGAKALAVNLSDLAAVGARPLAFTLALGLPTWADLTFSERFFQGMATIAGRASILLCGGDLSKSDKLHVSITVFGEKQDCFLSRASARPGWLLFVAGKLGLARAGLFALEELPAAQARQLFPQACAAHLRPEPLLQTGLTLAAIAKNSANMALMDVSDGLARDLPRLLQSSSCCGANIELPPWAIAPEVSAWAARKGLDPVIETYLGGEDYALLGACPLELWPRIGAALPEIWRLGSISGQPGIFCNGRAMQDVMGFDHFARS